MKGHKRKMLMALNLKSPKNISVKNRFSDLNKEQEGQDKLRNDIKSDRWDKFLKEGCHARREAQMCVSST